MPVFPLKLQKTYYDKGFFNVTVDFDRYVRRGDGPVILQLGKGGAKIQATVNRSANTNGTPRINGGTALRHWFSKNFKPMDTVNIDVSSMELIVLEESRLPSGPRHSPLVESEVKVVELPVASPERQSDVSESLEPRSEPQAEPRLPVSDLTMLILDFNRLVAAGEIEIYNEFSLQHELGVFLRSRLSGCKVQFERNVSHYDLAKHEYEKREIDITIVDAVTGRPIGAIELKYPRSGQVPETMFSFCKDILFLEQLVASGFGKGYFLAVVDDATFYSGNTEGIYGYFRGGKPITGTIQKPTGAKDAAVTINGTYTATWSPLAGHSKFCLIRL